MRSNIQNLYNIFRINSTHTMVIGGFNPVFGDEGGHQNKRTWMYNTTHWVETSRTSIARDRPACSLVNLPNGKVLDYSWTIC